MLKWEENGHKCELRLVLNGGTWEPSRTVIARDIVAALEANPDVKREVMSKLSTKPPEVVHARGTFRGVPFAARLRKDSDNPVCFSISVPLRGACMSVIYWPAQELPRWRTELAVPDTKLILEGEGNDFQQALDRLEKDLAVLHRWAGEIAVETSAAEQQQECA